MRRIVLNSAANLTSSMMTMILSFMYVPKLYSLLGNESYGIWILAFSIMGILSFLQFGFDSSLVRHIAHARGTGDYLLLARYGSTGLVFYSMIALLGCIGILSFSLLGKMSILGISQLHEQLARSVLLLTGIVFIAQTLNMFVSAIFRGFENYIMPSVASMIGAITTYPISIFVLKIGGDLRWLVVLQAIWLFLVVILGLVILQKVYKVGISLHNWRITEFREQVTFGTPFFISTLCSTVAGSSDKMILGNVLGVGQIPVYSIPQRLTSTITSFTSSIFSILYPRVVRSISSAKLDNDVKGTTEKLMYVSLRVQTVTVGILIIPLIVVAKTFLRLWMGNDFAAQATMIVYILSIFSLVNGSRYIYGMVIATEKRSMNAFAKYMIIYTVGLLILVYVGAKLFGVAGIAGGVLISEVFLALVSYSLAMRTECLRKSSMFTKYSLKWMSIVLSMSAIAIVISEHLSTYQFGWWAFFFIGGSSVLITLGVLSMFKCVPWDDIRSTLDLGWRLKEGKPRQ